MLSVRKWSKWSRTAFSTSRAASGLVRRSLVWLWNCGSRMNTLSMISAPVITSSAEMSLAFFCPISSPNARKPWVERRAQALLVGAAVGRGHGVAVPAERAVGPQRPGDRPFDAALLVGKVLRADEGLRGDAFALADLLGKVIGQAAGELEHRLGRHVVARQRGGALPADLDPGVEVGLRARELEQALGAELALAEDLGVGREADRRAAPVGRRRRAAAAARSPARGRIPARTAGGRARPRPGCGSTAR